MWLQLFGKVRHKPALGICVAKQNYVAIHFARVDHIVMFGLARDHERAAGFDCHCQQTGARARNHSDQFVFAGLFQFAIRNIASGKS